MGPLGPLGAQQNQHAALSSLGGQPIRELRTLSLALCPRLKRGEGGRPRGPEEEGLHMHLLLVVRWMLGPNINARRGPRSCFYFVVFPPGHRHGPFLPTLPVWSWGHYQIVHAPPDKTTTTTTTKQKKHQPSRMLGKQKPRKGAGKMTTVHQSMHAQAAWEAVCAPPHPRTSNHILSHLARMAARLRLNVSLVEHDEEKGMGDIGLFCRVGHPSRATFFTC